MMKLLLLSSLSCWLFILLVQLLHYNGVTALDSLNLDLEFLDQIDLSPLGVPNLDKYQLQYDLIVLEDADDLHDNNNNNNNNNKCNYVLTITFQKPSSDSAVGSSPNFEGNCHPNNSNGFAPDGLPWHEPRRYWMEFPQYVEETMGFNHMSLYWGPCGLPPKGLRQPRYDMNFYMVPPQYRTFWVCDSEQEYQTPTLPVKCDLNQATFVGRRMFSLPTLERDVYFLANMPNQFQPDPISPEAYQYEGLISYRAETTPETPDDWELPTFHMSTYDGDTVSWRALIPESFIPDANVNSDFRGTQYYAFQTQPRLPSSWNMTYSGQTKLVTIKLMGSAGMCGDAFEAAKQEQEIGK